MTIGSIFLGIALLLVVGLFLARPFLLHPDELVNDGKQPGKRQQLTMEKNAILAEIRELEFDHETGKIPTEVFEPQREAMMAHAARLLEELDQLKTQRVVKTRPTVDHDIEAAVAQMRRKPAKASGPSARPAATNGRSQAEYCPECGTAVDKGDKFCAACGHPLTAHQPA